MNRNHYAIAGLVVVALLGVAWAMGWIGDDGYSDDPAVAELEQLRDKSLTKPQEERADMRRDFSERMRQLEPQQRQAFMESSMPIFAKMMEQRIDEFLALPPEEQQKRLDERIDQMEQWREEREAEGKAPGGPPWGAGNMSPDKQDEMRKKMLDWTTPDQRAKFEQAMNMMNDRRSERGLEPVGPR